MKKNFLALTMIACTSMLHSSSANLKKELSKEELTTKVRTLESDLNTRFEAFNTQHENDVHNACGRIKTLEEAIPTLSESMGNQIQAVIARLQALEEKSKKDATDFYQLATQALNKIEDLNKTMEDSPQHTLKTPTELQQLNDRVKTLESELALSKSDITTIRRLLSVIKVTTTMCAIVYAAEQIEESKNLKNIACAFLRGLIPSRIFSARAVPVATPPTNI